MNGSTTSIAMHVLCSARQTETKKGLLYKCKPVGGGGETSGKGITK